MSVGVADQFDLFGGVDPAERVGVAPVTAELEALATALPRGLRLGTSSWSFPGWAGVVYGRRVSESLLSRDGLRSYARHALFSTVGLDRTFYAPMAAEEFRRLAAQVPPTFRFMVKAHAAITTPPDQRGRVNESEGAHRFLDASYTCDRVVVPAVEGLGAQLGVILFQFPPLGARFLRDLDPMLSRLDAFFEALPRGPQYAVEVRDSAFLNSEYGRVLARHGVGHCFNVHPRMPSVLVQYERLEASLVPPPCSVVRWMLHPTLDYEAARERYFPFDHVLDPDFTRRRELAELIEKLLVPENEVLVVANNKAEGSAPLSLRALAGEVVARQSLQSTGAAR